MTATGAARRTHDALQVRPLNVAVVGATGNVGMMMLRVLAERAIPIASLRAFASARSAGQRVRCAGHDATVEQLDATPTESLRGIDVALFSAGGERALEHAPRFAQAGAVVVDNSSAFRMQQGTPLVVPEVNAGDALQHDGIVTNPNCSTIQLVVALKPLLDAVGLERVQVTTFQSVSGTGLAAIEELQRQSAASLEAQPFSASVYPKQIAFNVLPHCDSFDAEGNTKEELKLVHESRKILHAPDLQVAATCVRVPVFVAHSEAVHLQTRSPIAPARARELLAAARGVVVVDDPAANEYPTPIDASGRDEVFVGRIRRDESVENGLAMFVVADNLRKGAATNAVQILEELARSGAWQ